MVPRREFYSRIFSSSGILADALDALSPLHLPSLAAPGDESATTALTAPSDLSSPSAFTDVLAQAYKSQEVAYTETNLPPTPPFKRPQHILKLQKGAVPHGEHVYYPP